MSFNPTRKDWLKFIRTIKNPYLLDAIIIEAEARKEELEEQIP